MRVAAFVGWQVRSVLGSLGGTAKNVPFDRYLRSFGLAPATQISKTLLAREKKQASEIGNRVREAFRRGVRKESS